MAGLFTSPVDLLRERSAKQHSEVLSQLKGRNSKDTFGRGLTSIALGLMGAFDDPDAEKVKQLDLIDAQEASPEQAQERQRIIGSMTPEMQKSYRDKESYGKLDFTDPDSLIKVGSFMYKNGNPTGATLALKGMELKQKQAKELAATSAAGTSLRKASKILAINVRNPDGSIRQVGSFDANNEEMPQLGEGEFVSSLGTGKRVPKNFRSPEEDARATKLKVMAEAKGRRFVERQDGFYKTRNAANKTLEDYDILTNNLAELSNTADDGSTTGYASALSILPVTDANVWKERRETIVSKNALQVMSSLKELSKTGSTGFGALSEKELELLQKALGSLNSAQGAKEIKKNILIMLKQLDSTRTRIKEGLVRESKWYDSNRPEGDPMLVDFEGSQMPKDIADMLSGG